MEKIQSKKLCKRWDNYQKEYGNNPDEETKEKWFYQIFKEESGVSIIDFEFEGDGETIYFERVPQLSDLMG